MTTQEWINDTNKLLGLLNDAKFMLPVIQPTHNAQVQRIFSKKLAADNLPIGYYSTEKTGLYVNPKYNIGDFPGEGKGGETTFKNGKQHKTKYFDNYKAYRQAISKDVGSVNLRLTENLKLDYTNSLQFANGSVTTSVNSADNVGKLNGALDKYGTRTFELSEDEKKKLSDRFAASVVKNIRRD